MIPYYSAAAQTAVDTSAIWLGILATVGTMLTVAAGAMKRMVDTHFEDRKTLRIKVDALEKAENDSIRRIAQLEVQLEQAQSAQQQQRDNHRLQLEDMQRRHTLALQAKDGEIETMRREIENLQQQLQGIRLQLNQINTQNEQVITERNTYREQNEKLLSEAKRLTAEIRSLVRENAMEIDTRKAYERRLLDAGVDTQELEVIRSEIIERIMKAGDEPL